MIIFINKYWLCITLLLLTTIATLSLWPVAHLPSVPGTDKTHHFIAYAALMLPTALKQPKHWLIITLALLAFSGAIELIQPYVNRYGEWLDMAANAFGLICGFILAKIILLLTAKKNASIH
ncbi:MAG: VanZ family protein [Colwellia sp.]|jgi:VanZ family protein|nr:VanZ family protein [Colwellia sp.]